MKKFLSIMLTIALLSSMLGGFSACSNNDKAYITKGEWLSLINSSFGMYNYTNEEPHVSGINNTNPYFKDVQIASEWEVIDTSKPLDLNENVDKWYAIETLINAGDFSPKTSSQDDKIQTAIDKGFLAGGIESKLGLSSNIEKTDAIDMLNKAQKNWAEATYDHKTEDVKYLDNVVNFNDDAGKNLDYTLNDNVTVMNINDLRSLKEGDVYVLPSNKNNPSVNVFKADKIVVDGNVAQIINSTDELPFENYADQIFVEESYMPDLLAGGTILDGNGNPVNIENNNKLQNYNAKNHYDISNLTNNDSNVDKLKLASGLKGKLSFKTPEGYEVSGEIKSDGVSFGVKIPMTKAGSDGLKAVIGVELSNIKVTNKVDYGFLTLHSAMAKIDYSNKISLGVEGEIEKYDGYLAPYNNGNGKFLTNLKRSVWKEKDTKTDKGAKNIKIGSIPFISSGLCTGYLEVGLNITVEGSVSVEVTFSGSKGIEYKNHNLRCINTNDSDITMKGSIKAEVTPYIGLGLKVLNVEVIGVKLEAGLGAKAETAIHLLDTYDHLIEATTEDAISPDVILPANNQEIDADVGTIKALAKSQGCKFEEVSSGTMKLHLAVCIDVKVYGILKIGLDEDTLACKLVKGFINNLLFEILNEDNATFGKFHLENFSSFVDECTKEGKPFDKDDSNASSLSDSSQDNSIFGDDLDINTYNLNIKLGESDVLKVTKIPHNYTDKDIIYKSSDSTTAFINSYGVIKAMKEGSTVITVSTKDGKFSKECSVIVTDSNKITITPLVI